MDNKFEEIVMIIYIISFEFNSLLLKYDNFYSVFFSIYTKHVGRLLKNI